MFRTFLAIVVILAALTVVMGCQFDPLTIPTVPEPSLQADSVDCGAGLYWDPESGSCEIDFGD